MGSATRVQSSYPSGLALGTDGSLYIAYRHLHAIWRLSSDGAFSAVAGCGASGDGGDGGPAIHALLSFPSGLAMGPDGSLYVADYGNHRVRQVSPDGVIATVAGIGHPGSAGDGGPAVESPLDHPAGVAVGADGILVIADTGNCRIRAVGAGGLVDTVAGTGAHRFSGDGGPARGAELAHPYGVAIDSGGCVYIADTSNGRVRRVSRDGTISTIAGTGAWGSSGDSGPAALARLQHPRVVAVGVDGNLYIAETYGHRVRKVSPDGIIDTVAGTGSRGAAGDGGPATGAQLNSPRAVAVGADGSLYIADSGNDRVRKVSPDGTISTLAGPGPPG